MTAPYVNATDPIEVSVNLDDQWWARLVIGWRDERVDVIWTEGGATHVGFVDEAQVERVAQP